MARSVNQAKFVSANQMAAGDTRNIIRVRLLSVDGTPLDLLGKTVTWSAKDKNGRLFAGRSATVYSGGEVGIKFSNADNVQKGPVYLQFKVVWSASENEFFPADGNLFLLMT